MNWSLSCVAHVLSMSMLVVLDIQGPALSVYTVQGNHLPTLVTLREVLVTLGTIAFSILGAFLIMASATMCFGAAVTVVVIATVILACSMQMQVYMNSNLEGDK